MNDCEPLLCFAQLVNGYGKYGDVFLGISTSGNSKNILYAAIVARAKGMKIIGLTGQKDSRLSAFAEFVLKCLKQKLTWCRSYIYLYIIVCA